MANPIQMYADWQHKRAVKAALLQKLKQLPPGVSMEAPHDTVGARAVMELLREYPKAITVVKWQSGLQICRTQDLDSLSDNLRGAMRGVGAFINPGDDL